MATTFESFKESLKPIVDFFTDLLDYLNPFSENFILLKLWDFLVDIISYINPFSENFLGKKIVESIGDLLHDLFVPEINPFDELFVKINDKFPFISQIQELFSYLVNYDNYGNTVPTFNMTWRGVTFSLINFDLFLEYRLWLHGIILAIAWFIFIRKTFHKIPSIIGGFK